MFIEAKKLINLPVASYDTGAKVGAIRQIVVDPENGKVLGFIVKTEGLFSPSLALSIIDIAEWDPNGLVTTSIDNLIPPKEIIHFNEIHLKDINLFQMSAKTEDGKKLGAVEDFLIDTDTQIVAKYYLKDLFNKSLVLPAEKVVKIDKQIIFADDVGELPTGVQGATT